MKERSVVRKIGESIASNVLETVAVLAEASELLWYQIKPVLIYHGVIKDNLCCPEDIILPEDKVKRPFLEKIRTLFRKSPV